MQYHTYPIFPLSYQFYGKFTVHRIHIDTQDGAETTAAAQSSVTKPFPETEPVDCEACFLETLHTSDQWTLWKSFVGFWCRIEVNFAILFTSKEKFSTA